MPEKEYYLHPSSIIDDNVTIGVGTKIWHFCHILSGAKIGKNCILGQNVMVGRGVKIGDGCKIQNNVSVFEGVELEDDVFCGPSLVFTNIKYPRAFINRKSEFKKTLVKKGATLGANATIICGVTIGGYSFIGAGAVLMRDVPDFAFFAGVPSVQKGWVCICGKIFKNTGEKRISCTECNRQYLINNQNFELIKKKHHRDKSINTEVGIIEDK